MLPEQTKTCKTSFNKIFDGFILFVKLKAQEREKHKIEKIGIHSKIMRNKCIYFLSQVIILKLVHTLEGLNMINNALDLSGYSKTCRIFLSNISYTPKGTSNRWRSQKLIKSQS